MKNKEQLLPALCLSAALGLLAACGNTNELTVSDADFGRNVQISQPTITDDVINPNDIINPAEPEPDTQAQIQPESANQRTMQTQPLSLDDDMGISIDGVWFPIWQDASGLLQALGDDFELYAAPSCVFDEGDDKEFAYDGIYVYTNPVNGRDMWYCIYFDSTEYSTARGIGIGNTIDEIFAVYGDGFYWEGETALTYSISGVQGDISSPFIQFTVSDRYVTAIEINFPTNTT